MRSVTWRSLVTMVVLASVVLAACAPAATPTPAPTKPAAAAPTTAPTAAPKPAAPAPTVAPTAAPKPAAPAPTTAAPAPTAATAPKPATIVEIPFGLVALAMNYSGYIIGNDLKIFEKHGVKPVMSLTQSSATAAQALLGKSYAIAGVTTDATILAEVKAPDLVIASTVMVKTPFSVLVNPKIKTVQDLKGKILGASTPKTGDAYQLRTILDHFGLKDERDYTIVVAGTPAARTEGLRKGTIDGVPMLEPQLSQLKAEGFTELIRGGDVPLLSNWPYVQLVTTRSWAKANEDTLVRFIRAWNEAIQVTYDPARKSEVVKILAKELKLEDKFVESAYQNWVIEQKIFSKDGKVSPQGLQTVINAMIDMGDLQAPGPKPADLYDPSFVEKALQAR